MNISWNSLNQAFYALPSINKNNLGKLSHHAATILKTFSSHLQHNPNLRMVTMMGLNLTIACVVDKFVSVAFKLFNCNLNQESKGATLRKVLRYSVITSCVLLGNLALNRLANLNLSRFILAASVTATLAIYYLYREIIIPDVFSDKEENDQEIANPVEEKLERIIPQLQPDAKKEEPNEVNHKAPEDLIDNGQLISPETPKEMKEEQKGDDHEGNLEAIKQKAEDDEKEPAIRELSSEFNQQELESLFAEDSKQNLEQNAFSETELFQPEPSPQNIGNKEEDAEKEFGNPGKTEPDSVESKKEEVQKELKKEVVEEKLYAKPVQIEAIIVESKEVVIGKEDKEKVVEEEFSSESAQTESDVVENKKESVEEENEEEVLEKELFPKPDLVEAVIVELKKEEVDEEPKSPTPVTNQLRRSQSEAESVKSNHQEAITPAGLSTGRRLDDEGINLGATGDFVKIETDESELNMSVDSLDKFLAEALIETGKYNPSGNK